MNFKIFSLVLPLFLFLLPGVSTAQKKTPFSINQSISDPNGTFKPTLSQPHGWLNTTTGKFKTYDRTDKVFKTVTAQQYGELYIGDTCAVSFAATTAAPVERLTAGYKSTEFTAVSDSVLKYTGTATKKFRVSYSVSLSFSEANNILSGYIAIGSTAVTKSRFKVTATTINERYVVSGSAIIELSTNQTVRLMVVPSTHSGTDIITVRDGNINLVEIKEE